jgi:hypothetical protein
VEEYPSGEVTLTPAPSAATLLFFGANESVAWIASFAALGIGGHDFLNRADQPIPDIGRLCSDQCETTLNRIAHNRSRVCRAVILRLGFDMTFHALFEIRKFACGGSDHRLPCVRDADPANLGAKVAKLRINGSDFAVQIVDYLNDGTRMVANSLMVSDEVSISAGRRGIKPRLHSRSCATFSSRAASCSL